MVRTLASVMAIELMRKGYLEAEAQVPDLSWSPVHSLRT